MKSATFEVASIDSQFHHDASQYLCCCGIHVLLCTKIVGIIHLLLALLALVLSFVLPTTVSEWKFFLHPAIYIALCVVVPIGIITVLMLFGAFKHSAPCLKPFIGLCFVSMAFQAVVFVGFAFFMNWGNGGEFVLLACFVGICLEGLSMVIVYRCYRYLCDLELHDAVEALCPPVFIA